MKHDNWTRIRELLDRLEALEARSLGHRDSETSAARGAIFDELSRLARSQGLAIYRRGDTLEAVSMVG